MKRYIVASAVITASVMAMSSCTTTDPGPVDTVPSPQSLMRTLDGSLKEKSGESYGGLAGSGGGPQSSSVEIAGDRSGLAVYAMCIGAAGEATVKIADESAVKMKCDSSSGVQVLADNVPLKGVRLTVAVEGAPTGSTWAIAAGAPNLD
ncbi:MULTISPECIES: hypothetical protein [Clavibacter]|uniref:hypothetical protein n=1 Tax=Clavibacter TaxID=1573 RepID=UPI000B1BA9A5|nr:MULTISPECIES: hypothetical protein [Clavibacter]MDA3804908.1 hypothetical protein [Clavibacter sp. CT19]